MSLDPASPLPEPERPPPTSSRVETDALLYGLVDLTSRLQRSHAVIGALEEAARGLRELGLSLVVTKLDRTTLSVAWADVDRDVAARLTLALGGPIHEASVRRPPDAPAQGDGRYFADVPRSLLALLGRDEGSTPEGDPRAGCLGPLSVRGAPWGFAAVFGTEVTSRDAAALSLFIRQLGSAIEAVATIESLELKNRQLAAIHAVAAAGGEQLDELIGSLARIAAEGTQSERSAIYIVDEELDELVLRGTYGGQPASVASNERISLFNSPTGRAACALKARATPSRAWPAGGVGGADASDRIEMAFVPLQINGRLAGSLNLGRTRGRGFSEEELRSAAVLGRQIAIQLESARLHEEARHRLGQLSLVLDITRLGAEACEVAPLADRALTLLSRALASDSALLHMLEDDELVLEADHHVGTPPGGASIRELQRLRLDDSTASGQAARSRRTVVFDASSWPEPSRELRLRTGARHFIALPLIAHERLVGTLSLLRRRDPAFSPEDVRLLESCASHLTVVIEHARLFEEERRRASDLWLINELGGLIAQQLELSAVLSTGVKHLTRITDIPNAFLCLLAPDGAHLEIVKSTVDNSPETPRRIAMNVASVASRSVHERTAVVIADVATDPRANRELSAYFGHTALLALPLLADGEAIGCVVLGETRGPRKFSASEIERALAVTNQLGAAIANARLFEDLRRSYEKLARAQEELVKRERLAALGELAAVVAHEVRNPLGAIFNSLVSLRRKVEPSADAELLLGILGEEADRLNRIVSQLLDFARPNEARLEPTSLEDVVAGALDVVASVAADATVELGMEVSALPPVPIDARMVRQALINLVVNAIQASPAGATVIVRVREETGNGRSLARIDVIDRGEGIDPELTSQIFKPFFTTKASGTGLGLPVVRRIVEAHQGELLLDSQLGEGTAFTILLPLEIAVPSSRRRHAPMPS